MSPRPPRSALRPGAPGGTRPTAPDAVSATGRGGVRATSRGAARSRTAAGATALALAALAAGPAVASAADVHVNSTSGVNAAGCGATEASACKTITYALQSSISQGGDTLALAPGTYAETIATSRTVSYRGTGPGVVLTGGSDGAVTGMSLSPATRVSVAGITFRAGVERTTAELRTSGPVDVSDVRFDSAKGLDDLDPNTATGRLTMVGAGGRASGITIDQPASGAGTALAAIGPLGDRAAGPVVDGVTMTARADGRAIVLQDATARDVHATSTADASVVLVSGARLERSEIVTPAVATAVHVGPGAPSEIHASTVRGGLVRLFSADLVSSQSTYLSGRRTAIASNSGGGDVHSTHDLVISRPPATPDEPGSSISANTSSVHLVGSYVSDRIIHSPQGTCTAVGSIGIVGTGLFDCGLTGVPADLGFVDAAAEDFRLRPGSPLIDAGPPETAPGLFDVLGLPRAVDGNADGVVRADVGPNEHQPTPETLLEPGTPPTTPGATATFAFRSTTAGASFSCVLDGGAPQPCDGGTFATGPLAEGAHTFSVAATLGAHIDPTPATTSFELRAAPPGGDTGPLPGGDPTPGGQPDRGGAGGGGGAPGSGGAAGPGGSTTEPAAVRLTGLRLLRTRFGAGRVPTRARVTARVSAKATVRVTLRRVTGRKTSRRVGKRVTLVVRRAGTVSVSLRRFVTRLPRGTYRIELTAGTATARSRTFAVRR